MRGRTGRAGLKGGHDGGGSLGRGVAAGFEALTLGFAILNPSFSIKSRDFFLVGLTRTESKLVRCPETSSTLFFQHWEACREDLLIFTVSGLIQTKMQYCKPK